MHNISPIQINEFINKKTSIIKRLGLKIFTEQLPEKIWCQGYILNTGDLNIESHYNAINNETYYIFEYKKDLLLVLTGPKTGPTIKTKINLFLIACSMQEELDLFKKI